MLRHNNALKQGRANARRIAWRYAKKGIKMNKIILVMLLGLSFGSLASKKGLEHSDLYVGNLDVLKSKIEAGADLTESINEKYYSPPLNVAIYEDNLEAVQLLLENGAQSYIHSKNTSNSKIVPTSRIASLFVTVGRTKNHKAYYELLLNYIDIKEDIDEVLYFVVTSDDESLSVVKSLIEQGANPTKNFVTSEIGHQSNSLYSSWKYGKSKVIYEYLLNHLAEAEQITAKQVFEKYVKPIDDRNTSNQECC